MKTLTIPEWLSFQLSHFSITDLVYPNLFLRMAVLTMVWAREARIGLYDVSGSAAANTQT